VEEAVGAQKWVGVQQVRIHIGVPCVHEKFARHVARRQFVVYFSIDRDQDGFSIFAVLVLT
jgi:hypothetical protein